jgi:hypothetical protein
VSRDAAIRAIRAGYDLHHGPSEDPDLALLDGDRLYAEGLAELAADGDLAAVGVMAEVIAASASALGAGDPAAAEAAWEQGIRSLSDGGQTA